MRGVNYSMAGCPIHRHMHPLSPLLSFNCTFSCDPSCHPIHEFDFLSSSSPPSTSAPTQSSTTRRNRVDLTPLRPRSPCPILAQSGFPHAHIHSPTRSRINLRIWCHLSPSCSRAPEVSLICYVAGVIGVRSFSFGFSPHQSYSSKNGDG